jgi:DNA-binding CsgD family transcriptional regulator
MNTIETPPAQHATTALTDFLFIGLESCAQGVALVDEHAQLIYANTTARNTWLDSGWHIERQRGHEHERPWHAQAQQQSAWLMALRQVCSRGLHQLLELQSANDPSFAALVPVMVNGLRRAFITFGRREFCGALELAMFASRYGLTGAEHQVLRQLALGHKPAEIAKMHGVAHCTVLTQVAAIRAKTHCTSVRQLLDKLARMPSLRLALNITSGL